jgi:phosphosulfolactate synthase (CoM biosynthesis protein A)
MNERTLAFLPLNPRAPKPRNRGLSEIRGPYYTPIGKRYLEDLLESMGAHIDLVKYAGGSFALMPPHVVREFIAVAHRYDVRVSTGGVLERVVTLGTDAVDLYLHECRELGFDIVEVSAGFIALGMGDWARLVQDVRAAGFEARVEVGLQCGVGGGTPEAGLASQSVRDPEHMYNQAEQLLEAGAAYVILGSEGVTESVSAWRTAIPVALVERVGLDRVIFEAADPAVFSWYIKTFGTDVNLFVDHSQIIQLEALRAGLWDTADTWRRVGSFLPD